MILAHTFGSLVILAFFIVAVSGGTKALILLTWKQGYQQQHVSSSEAWGAMFSVLKKLTSFLIRRWMVATLSVAVCLASLFMGADFQASVGLMTIAFAIVGLLSSPATFRALRVSTLCAALMFQRRLAV